jgi:predicted nuclease with TOPRIM domain
MLEEKDKMIDYNQMVLKELERLNTNYEKMRNDMDNRFSDLNQKLTEFKNVEGKVDSHAKWVERVNDVWSPSQMKEAKDEIYQQKNRWVAAIAIITFVQVAVGVAIAVWNNVK